MKEFKSSIKFKEQGKNRNKQSQQRASSMRDQRTQASMNC